MENYVALVLGVSVGCNRFSHRQLLKLFIFLVINCFSYIVIF